MSAAHGVCRVLLVEASSESQSSEIPPQPKFEKRHKEPQSDQGPRVATDSKSRSLWLPCFSLSTLSFGDLIPARRRDLKSPKTQVTQVPSDTELVCRAGPHARLPEVRAGLAGSFAAFGFCSIDIARSPPPRPPQGRVSKPVLSPCEVSATASDLVRAVSEALPDLDNERPRCTEEVSFDI